MRHWHNIAWGLVLAVAFSGCSGPKLAPVQGRVTLADGSPLKGAAIAFDDPVAHFSARGFTGDDGTYTLTTFKPGDGAPVGTYRVVVHHPQPQDSSQPDIKGLFHSRYESPDKSGLQYAVHSGSNTFDIKLDAAEPARAAGARR